MSNTPVSINEPQTGGAGGEPPPAEAPVLTAISPESVTLQADGLGTFALTATGSGFSAESVIVFDGVDMATTFVSATELQAATVPTGTTVATVDVEVANGEDVSEVITFDFTDIVGTRATKKSVRKPSKGKRKR